MTHKTLALFPGQGSQEVGMGKELAATDPIARELFQQADEVLGFPLSRMCFEGPAEELTKTAVAQPAILTVSTIMWRIAQRDLGASLGVIAAAGHSLGEYSAYVAAGALSFEDAVRTVHQRGRFMQEAVAPGVGAMVAVLGVELSVVEGVAQQIATVPGQVVEIANINDPTQVVVAGKTESIALFSEAMAKASDKVKLVQLQVSAPFHCSLMRPAEERLAEILGTLRILKPSFPVYSNFLARHVTEPEEIRRTLRQQVTGKVRWVESMEKALQELTPTRALEFGNGSVLCGLFRRINRSFPRTSVDSLAVVQQLRSEATPVS